MSRSPLDIDDLVEHWTLLPDELDLVVRLHEPSRLVFAVWLKFYTRHGRFPRGRGEVHDDAVAFVARQLKVSAGELGLVEWAGRTAERHRAAIRAHLGFRECSTADAEKLTGWLAAEVACKERRFDLVREELLGECRRELIEPPAEARVERIVRSALHQAEETLCARVQSRLPADVVDRLEELAAGADDGPSLLATIKSVPGSVSLDSMLTEIDKLRAVRAVGVPAAALADVAPKVVAGWRARAMVEAPSHLARHTPALRLTMLAALLRLREREITDALVELLIATVHRIDARAQRKVTNELIAEFKRVTGKENLLFRIAEASLTAPESRVRDVVFPAVAGGEQTLRDVVAEFRSKGPTYRRTVKTSMRASYISHYRKGLIQLLDVLEFRSSNSTHRPVIAALELIARYARGSVQYYPDGEQVPQHRGTTGDWADLVVKVDQRGRRRVVRMVYEVCTFQALREALRCKEIWVVGADTFRNPDEDLPADFESRRAEHYGALRKPLDPTAFIDGLREEMRAELTALHDGLDRLPWLSVKARPGGAGIKLEPLDALPEPKNLRRLKREIERQWGTVALIDMLKEAALRTGCLSAATGVGARSGMDAAVLAERLLLCVYGYGTNTGIKAAAAGDHGHGEDDLRYVRRRFLSAETARAMAVQIANATFAVRSEQVWGTGSTAVASDSTHFGAYDQNIFTQWHSRYGGRGVLIYWHVERKSMAIHSQLISCTASEVAAMVEGAVRHGTTMQVEANYTDSHGQSEIGFGITRLLGFDLLPRIKRINHVKLYRSGPGEASSWPRLAPAMIGRAIRWDLIAEQYDQMIKYATAIRTGTASTEAILRRFTRAASHPTYQAMLEVGRAVKTIFVARYLRDRDLQREIHDGLNVAEGWNGGNQVLFYGKGGDIATNRRDEQELSVACLHVLQAAVAYVNTLLVQDVLAEPAWADALTAEDRRGLTPLFWTHVAPYGQVKLNMTQRLALRGAPADVPR